MGIVQGLLNLVGPDPVYVRSSEPCMYRTTAAGLAALAETLRIRRQSSTLNSITFDQIHAFWEALLTPVLSRCRNYAMD